MATSQKKKNHCTIIISDAAAQLKVTPGIIRAFATPSDIKTALEDRLGLKPTMYGVWWDEATVDDLVEKFNHYV